MFHFGYNPPCLVMEGVQVCLWCAATAIRFHSFIHMHTAWPDSSVPLSSSWLKKCGWSPCPPRGATARVHFQLLIRSGIWFPELTHHAQRHFGQSQKHIYIMKSWKCTGKRVCWKIRIRGWVCDTPHAPVNLPICQSTAAEPDAKIMSVHVLRAS